jgi:hypothetical protein
VSHSLKNRSTLDDSGSITAGKNGADKVNIVIDWFAMTAGVRGVEEEIDSERTHLRDSMSIEVGQAATSPISAIDAASAIASIDEPRKIF